MKEDSGGNDQERSEESRERGFEVTDANARNVVKFTIGLLVFIGLTLSVLAWAYHLRVKPGQHGKSANGNSSFTQSDSQITSIEQDRNDLNKEINEHLKGYHWVDEKQGVLQIPIEEAMRLIATKEDK